MGCIGGDRKKIHTLIDAYTVHNTESGHMNTQHNTTFFTAHLENKWCKSGMITLIAYVLIFYELQDYSLLKK